jgi:hypothetical protein
MVEARRFHDEAALQLISKCHQANQEYLRFNPTDAFGWGELAVADIDISGLLFREGRVAEALRAARTARQSDRDPRNTTDSVLTMARLGQAIARWEAQRENRAAADDALQEARHSYNAVSTGHNASEVMTQVWAESFETTERQIRLALGENAAVYAMSTNALPRLEKLREGTTNRTARRELLYYERQALEQAARAALNLQHYAEAETAARALLPLHPESEIISDYPYLDQPDDVVWGRVLLAQAAVGQGRKAEAQKTLEPALAHYRDAEAHGAACVIFRQHFARALYVQSLAELTDAAGLTRCREELNEAGRLLQSLTDEGRQLHDSKELLSWIACEQKN